MSETIVPVEASVHCYATMNGTVTDGYHGAGRCRQLIAGAAGTPRVRGARPRATPQD